MDHQYADFGFSKLFTIGFKMVLMSKTGIKFVNLSHGYCILYEPALSSNQGQVHFTQQQKFRYAGNEKLCGKTFIILIKIVPILYAFSNYYLFLGHGQLIWLNETLKH